MIIGVTYAWLTYQCNNTSLKSTDGTNYLACTNCNGNFSNASNNSTLDILEKEISTGNTYYQVYLWYDNSGGTNPSSNIYFDVELTASVSGAAIYHTVQYLNEMGGVLLD